MNSKSLFKNSSSITSPSVVATEKRSAFQSSDGITLWTLANRLMVILSARRRVRVGELGLYPAIGRAPDAVERLANALALVLAYALFLAAAALALSAFYIGRPAAALVATAAGAVAFYLVLKGEAALDAQALDEFEG